MQKWVIKKLGSESWRSYLSFILMLMGLYGFNALASTALWLQWSVLLVTFALMAIILYPAPSVKQLLVLIEGAKIELRKVVWPSRDETMRVTVMVCAVVVIVAMILWAIDHLLMTMVGHFAE